MNLTRQLASASIVGLSHRKLFYNNQDAYKIINKDGFIVAVVCDGCGSSLHSEVGAKLTTGFVANYCFDTFRFKKFDNRELVDAIIHFYKNVAKASLAKDSKKFIKDTFFTTVIGCIISDKQNVIFSAGDGVIVVDNDIEVIHQNNAPKYLAHNIINDTNFVFQEKMIQGDTFERILIATDGIEDLWNYETPENIVHQLFHDDNFNNEIRLSKLLTQSKIYDDTTIVLIR